jgi:signal transduction histidine kinase
MHDVVAHSLTVMIVQAQAAEAHLCSVRGDRARATEAVMAVQQIGRGALAETRRLVGALADGGTAELSPSPTLSQVDGLVSTLRAAGLPVTLVVMGVRRAVPADVDLTCYRLVQEALTNVVKHAGSAPVEVRISFRPDSVAVEVADQGPGPGASAGRDGAGGRGLRGMRHRVEACGGRLQVDSSPNGGFVVAASFPAARQGITETVHGAAE